MNYDALHFIAYGFVTYLALYYTYLALFSLLVVANQCNISKIFTWYDKYVIKEVSCFVSFVIVKNRDYSPPIVTVAKRSIEIGSLHVEK